MNKSNQKNLAARNGIAAAVFYALNILLFPISLLGYVIHVAYLLITVRKTGVSVSAQGPLSARWTQHILGVRQDEAAYRLMNELVASFPWGWYLVSAPLLLAHRLTGFVPLAFRYPFKGDVPKQYEASARQTFLDQIVEKNLGLITQFVILGAGFDTRPYRLPKDTPVRSFEVDTPKTQAIKRALLTKTSVDAGRVNFVAADFEKDDWLEKLVESGFDPAKPALFLWEGVTIYLDRQAVEATLRKIATAAPGSMVAFDYFTTESLESPALYWRYARWATKAAGEPLKFGIDSTPPSRQRLAEFLQACGLALDEQRTLGQETAGQRAWGGFATAVVK